jgi:hypothetical protein
MNTATQLSAARTELELFQRNYGHIVFEYLKGGGKKTTALNGKMPDAVQLEKIVKHYFEKVEAVSKLTRIMNQEYLSTVNIKEQKPLYAPKKAHAA